MIRYRLSKNYTMREVAGEVILFGLKNGVLDSGLSIVFNETGAELCRMLPEECTVAELVKCLVDKYGISTEEARKDVGIFIDKCSEEQLIDEIE